MTTLMQSLHTLLRHRWRDESDARRTLPHRFAHLLRLRQRGAGRGQRGQPRWTPPRCNDWKRAWRPANVATPARSASRWRRACQ